jgi:hypothetical protein
VRLDGALLVVGLVILVGLSVAILFVGRRLLPRARARSRELDEQLAEVARVTQSVRLAAERGSISRETESKLLTQLHEVRGALLTTAKRDTSGEA